jgi:hypothetical protein
MNIRHFTLRSAFAAVLLGGLAAQMSAAPICGSGAGWVSTCTAGDYALPWFATGQINGGLSIGLDGTAVIRLGAPSAGTVATEILSLSLAGPGVTLTLIGPPTLGLITQDIGDPNLADSFFDIFFELNIGPGLLLHNNVPANLFAGGLTSWPTANTYSLTNAPIQLFDNLNQPAGFLTAAGHTPNPEPFSVILVTSGLAGMFFARKRLRSRD